MVDGIDMLGKMSDGMRMNITGRDGKIDMLKNKINIHKKINAKKKIGHLVEGG